MVCSTACATAYAIKQRCKQDAKTINDRVKKWKHENKTLTQLRNEARAEFQKWVRWRDRLEGCVSCGTSTAQIYHAGHFLKAEIYTGLIFNEDNCHKQCAQCNFYLDGNEAEYFLGLVKRIGKERVDFLYKVKDAARITKFTREELIDIKEKYKQLNQKKHE